MDRAAIAVLAIGHVFCDLCQGAIPAFLPFFVVEHHFSYTAAAGLILAANLASSIIQPLFGQFADRLSAPWLMPVGLLIAGTGLALTSIAPNYWLIALSVALSGIGIAAFHPEAARLINAASGDRKATSMSIFSIGGNTGFALGPLVVTGLLLALGLKSGILLLIPIVIVSFVLINAFRRFSQYSNKGRLKSHSEVKSDQRADEWSPFARLTSTIICRSIIFYGLNTFLPLYWTVVLHRSKAEGGIALTVLLASGLLGTFIGGQLADRFGRRIVVIIGLGMLTPLLLAFVTIGTENSAVAIVLLMLIGFALYAPFSVMVVMGQEYLPNHVGTASGVTLGLAITVGGIVAPVLGRVADLYSIHTALVCLALVPLLATTLSLSLPHSRIINKSLL